MNKKIDFTKWIEDQGARCTEMLIDFAGRLMAKLEKEDLLSQIIAVPEDVHVPVDLEISYLLERRKNLLRESATLKKEIELIESRVAHLLCPYKEGDILTDGKSRVQLAGITYQPWTSARYGMTGYLIRKKDGKPSGRAIALHPPEKWVKV